MMQAEPETELTPTPSSTKIPLKDVELEDDIEDEETKKRREREKSFWTKLWQGGALSSLGVNAAAMAIEGGGASIAMGVIACIIAPVVFKRQMDLQDTDTLRRVQNQLRHEVNKFQIENEKLDGEISKLEVEVNGLKETEQKLENITKEQGTNVETLVGLVKENGEIQTKMKEALRKETLQDILSIVLQSDFDQSYDIGSHEVDMLLMRLKLDERVVVDEERLRNKVADGPLPISAIVRNFVDDTIPEEERFCHLKEDKPVVAAA